MLWICATVRACVWPWRSENEVIIVYGYSRYQSVISLGARPHFSGIFSWGRWESNPHELPRPLLRRLRLPFRHFPGSLRLIRVEQALSLGRILNGADPEAHLDRAARED
jgi:hypothetical protein